MSKFSLFFFSAALIFSSCKKDNSSTNSNTPATPNYADSIKIGLWGHYNFNGSMNDLSGRNHQINGFNGIQLGLDMWGNDNSALDFDGTNDYAIIDSGKVFPAGNFSISFTFMPRNTYGRLFQKANRNDARGASFGVGFDDVLNNKRLIFNITKDNNICNVFTDASNSTPMTIPKVIANYAWYHIVIQFVDGLEKVYLNGSLLFTLPTPNQSFNNCPLATFNLGTWWMNDPHYFNGKMDNLRIYTRAIGAEEVKYLYNNQL